MMHMIQFSVGGQSYMWMWYNGSVYTGGGAAEAYGKASTPAAIGAVTTLVLEF